MTDKSAREVLLEIAELMECDPQTSDAFGTDLMDDVRAVLATAPAEPPEGSDAYMLTAEQYDALVRDAMLWRKQSAPRSGEVAPLIERLRAWIASFPHSAPLRVDLEAAADALARLSAPVPDKPTHRPNCASLEPYPFSAKCDCGAVK